MREEVVETIPEMIPRGEVHKELENKKMIFVTEVDEFIFQLNKELEANIVKQKEKKIPKNASGRLCAQVDNNYWFL